MAANKLASQRTDHRETLDIAVSGMSCASCVARVEKALNAAPGVSGAVVNLATERARMTLAPNADGSSIVAAVRSAGYEPLEHVIDLKITGMTCASCVSRVEKALKATPGVIDASVNLATERASVRALSSNIAPALIAAVANAGYQAEVARNDADQIDRERAARDAERTSLARAVIVAAVASIPLLVVEMGAHLFDGLHHFLSARIGDDVVKIGSFLLATLVQFGPGLRFYAKGWPALMRGAPDMNSLVMLGTSAAYAYSVVSTFAPRLLPAGVDYTYFEAGAVVITLILLGRWFEAKAKGRTSEAIRRLMTLQAKSARVLRNGVEQDVGIEAVRVGDIVIVRPGERIAVDGEVTDGSSYVDESMITGEPIPAHKTIGAQVVGGSINKSGAFRFKTSKIGADTLLAQIVRTVEAAQASKLPIQSLVDQVTAWFVPAVIAAAVATFLIWLAFGPSPALTFALVNAVAVLIIACPCAMGLATPTSIMVGTGKAAEMGVLFRRGEALQALSAVDVVALDKTGTLTKGQPELTDFIVGPGFSENDALRAIASVENLSEHPVAKAIAADATRRGLTLATPQNFAAEAGYGVSASIDGRHVEVGADRMMRRNGVDISSVAAQAESLAHAGKTPIYAAIDGKLAAVIAVADAIKDTTPAAINALHAMGARIVMITGDNRGVAEAIARELGIDEAIAETLPTGKADIIARLQKNGDVKVAFVGDGVNDAPALAQADVGLAIGTGTDVAIESADIVLMSGDLRNVPNAIALSRATIANIRQNLAWAFGYNILLIPVAAGALYPAFGILMSPIFAGLAMAFSSVSVLANALRLRRFSPPHEAARTPTPAPRLAPAE